MTSTRLFTRLLIASLVLVAACSDDPDDLADDSDIADRKVRSRDAKIVLPIPDEVSFDADKASLGKRLFFDPLLSSDGSISCASCHDLALGGTDRKPTSPGVKGRKGRRNSPTVFNARFNFRQFWDGRVENLSEQAEGPILNPDEMGNESWDGVLERLRKAPEYAKEFDSIFDDGISSASVKDAIGEYVGSLITPGSAFDRFLGGDAEAMDEEQKTGWDLFKSLNCVSCHHGVGIGGTMFQKFGVFGPRPGRGNGAAKKDEGRFEITGRARDRHVFKVPSLRNVAVTAPFLHDGAIATLEEVVEIMVNLQTGREAATEEVRAIKRFLEALTGRHEGEILE